jgi:hypothetical protein
VSVYLSVAPPDGFGTWGEADWQRWLRDHPWEAAERLCSRGDWATFLYQVRQHARRGGKALEPLLEQLVNERPLTAQQTEDLRQALNAARSELDAQPAEAARQTDAGFAGAEDLETRIAAARARAGKEPTLAEAWADLFGRIGKLLDDAIARKRGVYFGNV